MTPAGACPRCGSELFAAPAEGAELLGCGRCGGVWLDSAGCHQLTQGTGKALVELAERAGRHATAPADLTSELRCPVCGQSLVRAELPGTAVSIDTCAAHGSWFDRNELRLVALHFANLPPPLQFRSADYQLPAPAPQSVLDVVLQAAFPPTKTVNDAIPYVAGVRAAGTFWSDDLLFPLLVIAIIGTMISGAMHVASLFGHTVTNGPLHLITFLGIFLPFGLGILANYQMGNAVAEVHGIAMYGRHFLRELGPLEWTALVLAELYAVVMALCLWPSGTSEIAVPGTDLTVANARAVWVCDLLFYVGSVGIVVVARRLARRTS